MLTSRCLAVSRRTVFSSREKANRLLFHAGTFGSSLNDRAVSSVADLLPHGSSLHQQIRKEAPLWQWRSVASLQHINCSGKSSGELETSGILRNLWSDAQRSSHTSYSIESCLDLQPRAQEPPGISSRGASTHASTYCLEFEVLQSRPFCSRPDGGSHVTISRAGPLAEYRHRLSEGKLRQGDQHQVDAVSLLQELYEAVIGVGGDNQFKVIVKGFWSRLLPRHMKKLTKGLYLWGGVGTGKTMLMDLFYDELPSWMLKTRIHFHDFMLSVHSRLQKHKGLQDPLSQVAAEQAKEMQLLCLDEFMVTDVADAMILNRLFSSLFEHGVVLIATSNRPPEKLYENGLQRELFLPFIALLQQRCVVHEIGSSTDYRRMTKVQQGKYFTGPDADELLAEKVKILAGGQPMEQCTVDVVMGRKLVVPRSAHGVAWFHFQELCEVPLGAADFFALCKNFHTVAVDGAPVFGAATRSSAYRFVTFVDVMYESRTGLIISAEGTPFQLFERVMTVASAPKRRTSRRPSTSRSEEADLLVDDELGFAKDRTVSRLIEMQSHEYERSQKISHDISL